MISWKDQRQYWVNEEQPYHYISVDEFAKAFKSFHVGRAIQRELGTPFNRSKSHPASLTRSKYGTNIKELMKACLSREVILMKRSAHFHILKTIQVSSIPLLCPFNIILTPKWLLLFSFQIEICAIIAATVFAQARKHHNSVEDGLVYLGALYFGLLTIMFSGFSELPSTIDKLPVFYKQRDLLFYPSWAFSLPVSILGIPISFIEVACWVATTYYVIGFDPSGMRSVYVTLMGNFTLLFWIILLNFKNS